MLLAASDNASASVRAKALHRAAEMDGYLGNFDRGIALGTEALELARASGDKWNAAWSLAVPPGRSSRMERWTVRLAT